MATNNIGSPGQGTQQFDPISAAIGLRVPVLAHGLKPPDFPNGFQVVEYIKGIPQIDTVITLLGNMMPMQPFEWEIEQRMASQYYPGNPEPSTQMFGPQRGPITIKGRFKDKRYKDSSLYGVSYQFSQALDKMVERGNIVSFGMKGGSGKFVRWGIVKKNNWKMKKLSWIDYEITFFVISETQPKNNYFASQELIAPDSFNQKLIDAASIFNATYSAIPTSMPTTIAGLINGLISKVAKNITNLTTFVSNAVGAVENIENSANRALGLIKNTRLSINSLMRRIDAISHTFSNFGKQSTANGKVVDTYTNLAYIHNATSAARTLSQILALMQKQFEALAQTLPLARYKVHVGDTLQNVAIKFYGASDNWDKIQTHNQLQSTVLVPGTVLEIPKL